MHLEIERQHMETTELEMHLCKKQSIKCPYPQASVAIPPATRETEGNRTQHTCVLVPFLLFLLAIASYPGGLRRMSRSLSTFV